jgi:hypothetical protein
LNIDDAELTDHVEGELASYKAPRVIVVVESLGPRRNGKLTIAAFERTPSPGRLDDQAAAAAGAGGFRRRGTDALVGGIGDADGAFLDAAPLVLCTPVTAP